MRTITFLSVPFFGLVLWVAAAVLGTLDHMSQTTQQARVPPASSAPAMITAGR